jgi:folate-binding protein YgfZ
MDNNQIVILEDRGLIAVEGLDVKNFLQSIISNNIEKVSESNSIFSGIFTSQGKYLYEFFIIKNNDGYFLDCDNTFKEELIKHLLKYKLRSKIEIKDFSSSYVIGITNKEKFNEIQNEMGSKEKTILYRESPFFLDTRSSKLGARILTSLEKLHLTIKKLNLKIIDKSNYLKIAHAEGIPIQGIKNLQDGLFGLESNFEELNAIDFKKGCYVGQENTARMKLKNKVRRKLIPITAKNTLKIADEIKFKDQIIGKILIDGVYPFALIKLFDPDFSEFYKEDLKVGETSVQIIVPSHFKFKNGD